MRSRSASSKRRSAATESNPSTFRRLPIENGTGSIATIGLDVQSRSPRGGFLFVLIRRNLVPKLPQALLGRRSAAYACGPTLAASATWATLPASDVFSKTIKVSDVEGFCRLRWQRTFALLDWTLRLLANQVQSLINRCQMMWNYCCCLILRICD